MVEGLVPDAHVWRLTGYAMQQLLCPFSEEAAGSHAMCCVCVSGLVRAFLVQHGKNLHSLFRLQITLRTCNATPADGCTAMYGVVHPTGPH